MLAASLAAVALGLSACGGGGSGAPAAAEPPAAEPSTAAPATETSPGGLVLNTGPAPWPAPPDPIERTRAAGLEPQLREFLAYHVHSQLDITVNGEPVVVPAGIGINIDDPGVQHGEVDGSPAYGGIELCDEPCISPLHTHDVTGLLHTESLESRSNTLGEFFTEWGVRLDENCVGGYCRPDATISVLVDGEEYDGNPADIELVDQRRIAIVIDEAAA